MSRNLREKVLALIEQKEKLETEIAELNAILQKNGVGMSDPLVDHEGFPLPQIDVYQVRHARHLIICKQNDHTDLMKQIEEGVVDYYKTTENPAPINGHHVEEKQYTEPFAKITVVHQGSPADAAGIHDGDLLVEFGSVNKENFRSLNDIGTIVEHSNGQKIYIKIKRGELFNRVALRPQQWEGRGLLGCSVVPL